MSRETGPRAQAPAGSFVRAGGKDGPQVIESKGKRWTEQAEAVFLEHLAATANVRLSARASGFSTVAIYKRRSNDPGFAERWHAALQQGYARIEMLLVRRATEALEGFAPDPEDVFPGMTVKDAISILGQHRATVAGEPRRHWRARPRTLDEVGESILQKLEAIETMRRDRLIEHEA